MRNEFVPKREFFDTMKRIEAELERFRQDLLLLDARLPQNLSGAMRYLQDHLFDSNLNVSTLKLRCDLRNNNVSTIFRSIVGVGIRDYIEMLRLDAADHLLRIGGFEIYLIAMSVGYDHQETFFRAFQRRFGCTPSRRRNAFRSSDGEVERTLEG